MLDKVPTDFATDPSITFKTKSVLKLKINI